MTAPEGDGMPTPPEAKPGAEQKPAQEPDAAPKPGKGELPPDFPDTLDELAAQPDDAPAEESTPNSDGTPDADTDTSAPDPKPETDPKTPNSDPDADPTIPDPDPATPDTDPTVPDPDPAAPDADPTPPDPDPDADADADTDPATPEAQTPEEKHKAEAAKFAQQLIDRKATEIHKHVIDNKINIDDPDELSDEDFELFTYAQIKNGWKEGVYTKADSEGIKLLNAKATTTDGEEAELQFIKEVKTEGGERVFVCQAEDPADAAKSITVTVTAEELATKHLEKTANSVASHFEDDEKDLVEWKAKGEKEDPPLTPDALKSSIENDAKEHGIMTIGNIRTAIENHFKDEDELPDEAKTFLDNLDDKTLADKTDMRQALAVMGVSRFGLLKEKQELQTEIDSLKGKTDPDSLRQRQEAEDKLALLDASDSAWKDADGKGETPFDKYFDDVIDGNVPPERAKEVIEAFTTGNFDALIDNTANLTDDEKGKLKKLLQSNFVQKGGRGLLMIILGAIVASAGAAVYAGVVGASGLSASMKRSA